MVALLPGILPEKELFRGTTSGAWVYPTPAVPCYQSGMNSMRQDTSVSEPLDALDAFPAAPENNLVRAARTRAFEIAILLWSAPFGILILTVFKIWRPPSMVRRALRLWSSGFIGAARVLMGVRYRIEGLDAVRHRPVIFVVNHQSYWESIALTALIANVNIISKAEAMDIPVFGWGLRHAPMTAVHRKRRGTNLRRIVREAASALDQGRSIVIYPEGTRVPPGGRLPFQRGFEHLYRQCDADIVPVVHNAGLCWPEGFKSKRPGLITLRFCAPIPAGRDAASVAIEVERTLNREKDRLLSSRVSV